MKSVPEAIFVMDTVKEHIAITEANKLGIPVIAVLDTDCDPDVVQYPIPGNDDAIRSGRLLCRVMSDAIEEGRFIANSLNKGDDAPSLDSEDKATEQAQAQAQAEAEAIEREMRVAENLQSEPDEAPSEETNEENNEENNEGA